MHIINRSTDSNTALRDTSSIFKLNGTCNEGIVNGLAALIYAYLSPFKTGQRKFTPAGKPG